MAINRKSRLSVKQMLEMHQGGRTYAQIASEAGVSAPVVLRAIRRAKLKEAASKTPEMVKALLLDSFTPEAVGKMSARDKIVGYKALSPRRRRGVRGDLDTQFEEWWEHYQYHGPFTKGAALPDREQAEAFFRSVMAGTWVAPDLAQIRIPEEATSEKG
jgi:hypothetical protein